MTKTTTTFDGSVTGTLRIVRGDTMDEQGYINDVGPKTIAVIVDGQGRAYPYLYVDILYNADDFGPVEPLTAERWGDGDRLGRQFSPDPGELERCGIKFDLCGSAAK